MNTHPKKCSYCGEIKHLWRANPALCKQCDQKKKMTLTQTDDGKQAKPFKYRTSEIKKFSTRQQRLNALYLVSNRQYLKDHPNCEANIMGICTGKSTTIHHKKGRGEYLLDTTTFLGCCMACHHYIEVNPEFAKAKGFSLSRLEKAV